MVIDVTGNLAGITRHDFCPFGEELSAGVGIRSASNGYSGNSVRQKFTGYEHDDETGLDFAQARYYANIQGRFISADPFYIDRARLGDPQRLNLYSYVRNNPLSLIDPTGMIINTKRLSGDDFRKWEEIVNLANATDENGNLLNPKLNELYKKLQNDERTFYIQGGELGTGTAGTFELELLKGNDFVSARITLDFEQIKKAEVADATHGGFKQFEGLRNQFEKFAEVAGHEFQHAVNALNNPLMAVLQTKLINAMRTALTQKEEVGIKSPTEIDMMMYTRDLLLIPDEKAAYSAEKTILQDLRAKYQRKKGK
jgi:RHS repeat-associated protein